MVDFWADLYQAPTGEETINQNAIPENSPFTIERGLHSELIVVIGIHWIGRRVVNSVEAKPCGPIEVAGFAEVAMQKRNLA